MNRSKTKNQSGRDPKKGEGTKEARVNPPEGSLEISKTKETVEIRDDLIEVEEKFGNGGNKETESDLSAQQMKDQDEEMAPVTAGETLGKSEEDSGSEEEEEEEGEIRCQISNRYLLHLYI